MDELSFVYYVKQFCEPIFREHGWHIETSMLMWKVCNLLTCEADLLTCKATVYGMVGCEVFSKENNQPNLLRVLCRPSLISSHDQSRELTFLWDTCAQRNCQ
jgi:hypothetical protein